MNPIFWKFKDAFDKIHKISSYHWFAGIATGAEPRSDADVFDLEWDAKTHLKISYFGDSSAYWNFIDTGDTGSQQARMTESLTIILS